MIIVSYATTNWMSGQLAFCSFITSIQPSSDSVIYLRSHRTVLTVRCIRRHKMIVNSLEIFSLANDFNRGDTHRIDCLMLAWISGCWVLTGIIMLLVVVILVEAVWHRDGILHAYVDRGCHWLKEKWRLFFICSIVVGASFKRPWTRFNHKFFLATWAHSCWHILAGINQLELLFWRIFFSDHCTWLLSNLVQCILTMKHLQQGFSL